jgi:hypothetical protein
MAAHEDQAHAPRRRMTELSTPTTLLRSLDVAALRRIVGAGFVVRVLLWALSSGSGDIRSWSRVARQVAAHGVRGLYEAGPPFRQSPVSALWAGLAANLSTWLEAPFELVFKVLPLSADVGLVALILTIVRRRGGTELDAWRAAAIQGTAMAAIWVTSHHGGLDSVLIFCVVAAVFLVDKGDRPLLAGIALAGAMHMHVVAVVLLPALWIAQASSVRGAVVFGLGLLLALSPLALPLSIQGPEFLVNAVVVGVGSNRWGLQFVFSEGAELAVIGSWFDVVGAVVGAWSWKLCLVASCALGLLARERRWSTLHLGEPRRRRIPRAHAQARHPICGAAGGVARSCRPTSGFALQRLVGGLRDGCVPRRLEGRDAVGVEPCGEHLLRGRSAGARQLACARLAGVDLAVAQVGCTG